MIYLFKSNQNLPKDAEHFQDLNWVYLGKNYLELLAWEQKLPATKRTSISRDLLHTSRKVRLELIQWTAEKALRYGPDLKWWMTALAGKNVMLSDFFLSLCNLQIVDQLISKDPQHSLIIVCEDWFMLRSLASLLRQRSIAFKLSPYASIDRIVDALKMFGYWIARWIKEICDFIFDLSAARISGVCSKTKPATASQPVTIIHTCVDQGCFNGEDFNDRYFAQLASWLTKQGKLVLTVPWIFNLHHSRLKTWFWFRRSKQNFLHWQDYVRYSDLISCIIQTLQRAFVLSGKQSFLDYDVTALVQKERIYSSCSKGGMLKFLSYQLAIKRWVGNGNICERYIDIFENMPPEKPALVAFRKYSPQTKLVGYQHSAGLPYEILGYSTTDKEWQVGIFPDKIVANSSFTRRFMLEQGFPKNALLSGPALRYQYLFERPQAVKCRIPSNQILVALPLELESSVEILMLLVQLKRQLEEHKLRVALKAHPMMLISELKQYIDLDVLPEDWCWIEGKVDQHLPMSLLVIAEGSVLLESAILELPFISVLKESKLTYNPLSIWEDQFEICKSIAPSDLRQDFKAILQKLCYETVDQRKALSALIMQGIGECNGKNLGAFLEPKFRI